jgi:hypothetical protein
MDDLTERAARRRCASASGRTGDDEPALPMAALLHRR